MRRRRRSDENGFGDDERRPEKSRGYFIGVVDGVSGEFWVETGHFSTFWCFSMKPAGAEHVSRAATMVVGAGDKSVSSAQLKDVEMGGSEGFWVKIGEFSRF